MSEKKFLSFILTEAILMIFLALLMLVIPKITEVTFGFMLCISLIIYGGYKTVASYLVRNIEAHYILNIINSLILLVGGILMLFAPIIDMTLIVTMLGMYLILQSVAQNAFILQMRNIFNNAKIGYFVSGMQLFFGILLLTLFPTLWMGGIIMGLNFLVSGIILLNMYMTKSYIL